MFGKSGGLFEETWVWQWLPVASISSDLASSSLLFQHHNSYRVGNSGIIHTARSFASSLGLSASSGSLSLIGSINRLSMNHQGEQAQEGLG